MLSRHLDDWELTLVNHGYRLKNMTELEQFDTKPAEFRAMCTNLLEPNG